MIRLRLRLRLRLRRRLRLRLRLRVRVDELEARLPHRSVRRHLTAGATRHVQHVRHAPLQKQRRLGRARLVAEEQVRHDLDGELHARRRRVRALVLQDG